MNKNYRKAVIKLKITNDSLKKILPEENLEK